MCGRLAKLLRSYPLENAVVMAFQGCVLFKSGYPALRSTPSRARVSYPVEVLAFLIKLRVSGWPLLFGELFEAILTPWSFLTPSLQLSPSFSQVRLVNFLLQTLGSYRGAVTNGTYRLSHRKSDCPALLGALADFQRLITSVSFLETSPSVLLPLFT